jgi:hypothetical protein
MGQPNHRASNAIRGGQPVKTKPENPYNRLKQRFQEFADSVKFAQRISMFRFGADEIREGQGFTLSDVRERVRAANQLEYDVLLIADENGDLRLQYRKRPVYPWL